MKSETVHKDLKEKMQDRLWRLNNLYYITDKTGKKIKFKPNWAQKHLLENVWYLNLILKARQLGFTTFICLLFLDTALFTSNTQCGIVAHNREDAEEFFANKIKFAYDNLPAAIKAARGAPSDSAKKLAFSNGSSIRVGTSLRSGTFQYLHISEFGKVCARFPAKAKEIVTGTLNTVEAGQHIFIESTAEGREGYFYDYCASAMKRQQSSKKPNKMQFKFFFYPWWKDPNYQLDPSGVVITAEMAKYFSDLAGKRVALSPAQKAWYVSKAETQQDDMLREYPATPEEAFQASVEGAYYGSVLTALRKARRITEVPYDAYLPVNTMWDIGINDKMAIWFHQRHGSENRLIDYMEGSGEGLAYWVRRLQDKGYIYGMHYMPHDSRNRSPQTGISFEDYARKLGLQNIRMVPRAKGPEEVLAHIEATRRFLRTSKIDEATCSQGVLCLENYRKEWDANLGEFKRSPLHNWASNGADALRTGAVGFVEMVAHSQADLMPTWAEDF